MSFGFGVLRPPPPLPQAGGGSTVTPICQFTICYTGMAGRAGPDPARMLRERLRLEFIPADKLRNVHIFVGSDKVVVFAIKPNAEHVSFEDETSLFPSDTMVAAFHLLLRAS